MILLQDSFKVGTRFLVEGPRTVKKPSLEEMTCSQSQHLVKSTVKGRPVNFLFRIDPVVRNESTHRVTIRIALTHSTLKCKLKRLFNHKIIISKYLLDDKNTMPNGHGY